jgi:hypothetical protein
MQLAMVGGPRMRVRGRCGTSKLWLVTVIIVLALLQLHVMVGVAATRVPSALLHENSFKVCADYINLYPSVSFGINGQLNFCVLQDYIVFQPVGTNCINDRSSHNRVLEVVSLN